MTTAYPLAWPDGWPRTPPARRARASFHSAQQTYDGQGRPGRRIVVALTVAAARRRLTDALDRLGARYVTLSTNVEVTRDGTPYSGRRPPEDPGVAVYFQMADTPMVLACDKWDRVEHNIAAIAGHIEAMRRQDRYGVGSTERAFAGYAALPPPRASDIARPWREVLAPIPDGLDAADTLTIAERRYRDKAGTSQPRSRGWAILPQFLPRNLGFGPLTPGRVLSYI